MRKITLQLHRFRTKHGLLPRQLVVVRKLESLEAWRCAQDLAYHAYLLTLDVRLAKHFALIDQIRRASLSVPANIAEGYALGSTAQFVRCLKLALGSAIELKSHLTVLFRLPLVPDYEKAPLLALCERVLGLTIGLIRALSRRSS